MSDPFASGLVSENGQVALAMVSFTAAADPDVRPAALSALTSATAVNTSSGAAPRATSVATRRSAAGSSAAPFAAAPVRAATRGGGLVALAGSRSWAAYPARALRRARRMICRSWVTRAGPAAAISRAPVMAARSRAAARGRTR